MAIFEFEPGKIAQHIMTYGVDTRPPLAVKSDKKKLNVYCEWLTDKYPELFETLLSGPDKVLIQKTFPASSGAKIEIPTFILTERGLVFTFPLKVRVEGTEDFDLATRPTIFLTSLKHFRATFPDRRIPRVGVVNEFVFDCGDTESLQIVASAISMNRWKKDLSGLELKLKNPQNGYNIILDIAPVLAQRVQLHNQAIARDTVGYGIRVKVDINNQDMSQNLDDAAIRSVLSFADEYLGEQLYPFLNNVELTDDYS